MAIEDDILNAIEQNNSERLKTLLNSITTLNLYNRKIGDSNVIQIAKALGANQTLATLYLFNNQIGDLGAIQIAKALETNQTLTTLDLGINQIGYSSAVQIAKALEANQTLTILYLYGNQIGDSGAIQIAKALEVNQTLTTLDLRYNQIGYAGAFQIGKALEINQTLTTLCLGNNQIGNFGASQIGKTLETNQTLISLCLYGNQIGDAGAVQIAKALETNQTLTEFYFGWNQVDKQRGIQIKNLIDRNYQLQTQCIVHLMPHYLWKSLHLEQAQQLLQQGVNPNGALLALTRHDNPQLKAIHHLLQLTQNNGLHILRGVFLEAITNAKNKNHPDIVNFLQQTLNNTSPIKAHKEKTEEKKYPGIKTKISTAEPPDEKVEAKISPETTIQALKDGNLQQAREELLKQDVNANGAILITLAKDELPQLKPIKDLLILHSNNGPLAIPDTVVSEAIRNAQDKNHPNVVHFLQNFLQLLNERNINSNISKEITLLKTLKTKWQTNVDLKLENHLQKIEQARAGEFTQEKSMLQAQINQLTKVLAKTQAEVKADTQAIQDNQIKLETLKIQMQDFEKIHDQENIQLLLRNIRQEFKAQLDTENKAQQAEFNQKLEALSEEITAELNSKETIYMIEVKAINATMEQLNKDDQNYEENLHTLTVKLKNVQSNQERFIDEYWIKQDLLRKQRELCSYPELRYFYRSIQLKLVEIFLAMKSIASNMINPLPNWKVTLFQKGIELAGSFISIPGSGLAVQAISAGVGLATQSVSESISFFTQNKTQTRIEQQFTFIPTLTEIEIVAESVARELAFRYQEQLFQLTPEGAKLLGECALARMMNYLDEHLDLLTLGSNAEQLQLLIVQQLITSCYKAKMKQGFWNLFNKQIPTKAGDLGWTESGILTEPGIYCPAQNNPEISEDRYYSGQIKVYLDSNLESIPLPIDTRPEKYGYRLGTVEEAEHLELSWSSNRITPEAKQKFCEQPNLLLLSKSEEEKQEQKIQEQIIYLEQQLTEQNQQNQMLQQKMEQMLQMMQNLTPPQQQPQTTSSPNLKPQ